MAKDIENKFKDGDKNESTSNNKKGSKYKKGVKSNPRFNARYPRKNDPSWYTKFADLAKVSGLFNYGLPLGQPLNYGLPNTADGLQNCKSIPGIAKLELMPAIGLSTDNNSAVNNMSRMIYSFIRHANSGSRNYESQDLMTYLLAIGSCYAYYASLVRLYGIIRSFSVSNLYIPKAYCDILGFNYESIVKNLANLRSYIGYFAARINQFAVPKAMSYYEHMLFMPLNVFMDYDDDKASLYLFDFDVLFKWDGTTFETGSALVTTNWGITSDKDFDFIQAKGEELINALTLNEDIGMMSGDILKAYGSAGIHELPIITEDYATYPIYDENILWQIHNARIIDSLPSDWEDYNVTQQGTALIFNPTRTVNYSAINKANGIHYILDSGSASPSIDENFENTRLHVRLDYTDTGENFQVGFVTLGSMFINRMSVWFYNKSYNDTNIPTVTYTILSDLLFNTTTGQASVLNSLKALTLWSTFRHRPITYVYETSGLGQITDTITSIYPVGDLHNFTTVSDNVIDQLHRTALLSEFYVPNMAQAAK